MENLSLIYLGAGLISGGAVAWFMAKSKYYAGVSKEDLNRNYITKELFINSEEKLAQKEDHILELTRDLSAMEENLKNSEALLKNQKAETEQLNSTLKKEFENISFKIMSEQGKTLLSSSSENLNKLLNPLREDIDKFKTKIEDTYKEESRDIVTLKTELKHLTELNNRVSEEAGKLTAALKGDSKVQGDWGEAQLEVIFENAGFLKDVHYKVQESFRDEEGKIKRPDFIVNLPGERNVVIDSKVSLTAYEKYFNTEEQEEKEKFLKEHITSIANHLRELNTKDYQDLHQINSPDYVLLFMPVESALNVIMHEKPDLIKAAFNNRIIVVTPITVMTILKTISYLWKQENQQKNAEEIAAKSGALYDKFATFIESFDKVGEHINKAGEIYDKAKGQLYTGRGNLIRRAEEIRELGAKTKKQLPPADDDRIEPAADKGDTDE